ncbi:unnamed protein product, partial [marine sediment metagenome]
IERSPADVGQTQASFDGELMTEQGIRIEVQNLAEVRQYLDELPENFFDDTKKVFKKAVLDADRQVKINLVTKMSVRTGALRRSIRTSVAGTQLNSLRASIYSAADVGGTPVVYAPVHEYGATISAINKYLRVPGGPYLNIPTEANKTPAGVMRKSSRMIFNEGGYIQKTRRGAWGVFLGSKMMFVLKKKVEIPARLGMVDAAEDQVPTILSSLAALLLKE